MKKPDDLLASLEGADESTLNKIEDAIREAYCRLGYLRTLRAAVTAKLDKKLARPRAYDSKMKSRRRLVAQYLTENGPTFPGELCRETGIPKGSIYFVLDHPWFANEQNGRVLTEQGRKEAMGAEEGQP